MTGISLRHLRYFDALARHGHFGQAAAACAISQPALSIQVRELETILGGALVERGGRPIRLTRLGAAVAERAREILRAVDDLPDLARAAGGPLTGPLRLGIIPTVAPYLLPGIVKGVAARLPGADLHPREAVTQRLVEALQDGRLDTAIVAIPVSEPALEERVLFEEEFVLVRPAAEAGQPVPGPEGLRGMRLLLLEEGHCFRDQALSFCGMPSAGAQTPMQTPMEGSSLATLVQMVAAGIGVTLIPEMAVPVETRSAAVSVARLPEPRPSRRIGMVWRRASPLTGPLAALAEIVGAARAAQIASPEPAAQTSASPIDTGGTGGTGPAG